LSFSLLDYQINPFYSGQIDCRGTVHGKIGSITSQNPSLADDKIFYCLAYFFENIGVI